MNVVTKENAEHYTWGNLCDGWHLAKSGNLSVIEERVPAGCAEVRHYHEKAEQFFYVISGVATLEVDGHIHVVGPSQGMHVPPGVSHQLRNTTSSDIRFLVISTPPSHGDRVSL